MAQVEIYTRPWCGYCGRARNLLQARGATFEEIDLDEEPEREQEMVRRTGGRTRVPQIFINGELVGGSDELAVLDAAGGLTVLLAAET